MEGGNMDKYQILKGYILKKIKNLNDLIIEDSDNASIYRKKIKRYEDHLHTLNYKKVRKMG